MYTWIVLEDKEDSENQERTQNGSYSHKNQNCKRLFLVPKKLYRNIRHFALQKPEKTLQEAYLAYIMIANGGEVTSFANTIELL